jgi:hypothetical protein
LPIINHLNYGDSNNLLMKESMISKAHQLFRNQLSPSLSQRLTGFSISQNIVDNLHTALTHALRPVQIGELALDLEEKNNSQIGWKKI